jgi:hypothetical protein
MTKTRLQIIQEMCYAWSHDSGLRKPDGRDILTSGMTSEEQRRLVENMSQVYDRVIQPLLESNNEQ